MHTENLFLQQLSPRLWSEVRPYLEHVPLPSREVLYEVDRFPKYVHFMVSGISSMVATMLDGDLVEVGLLGSEGFPEFVHLLGPQTGTTRCFMQLSGSGLRMSFDRFQRVMQREPEVLMLVHRLVQHHALSLAQLSACNRLHNLPDRLARWLLMVHDRVQRAELRITQEGLAAMVGSNRSSVNIAAGILQDRGAITFKRGLIRICNLQELESAACECYPVVRKLYQDLYR